jgi:hypothetical protein
MLALVKITQHFSLLPDRWFVNVGARWLLKRLVVIVALFLLINVYLGVRGVIGLM